MIVNHALFFSDLALRQAGVSLLPDYDVVIFDEAHTLESVAGSHLGVAVSRGQIEYALNKLYNDRTNRGLLVHHRLPELQRDVDLVRERCDLFFEDVWVRTCRGQFGEQRVREAAEDENALSPALLMLARKLRRVRYNVADEEEQQDFTASADRLETIAGEVETWRKQGLEDAVYWVDAGARRGRAPRIKLAAAPIDVSAALREHLFDRVGTVVLTSATLAIGDGADFSFTAGRLGMTNAENLRLGSPFDYEQRVRLLLVENAPDPSDKAAYDQTCAAAIKWFAAETDGRTLVLFTSYESLRRAATALGPWLQARQLALYAQGQGAPPNLLLERFKQQPRGVLLGVDSFWQGVDVPGDALQTVIIAKLPFSVPDQPLLAARLDAIRTRGGAPFRDYQLPEAILKFRQGFGRLIRTASDRGRVVVVDPRLTTKPYGRAFLASVPRCTVERIQLDDPAVNLARRP